MRFLMLLDGKVWVCLFACLLFYPCIRYALSFGLNVMGSGHRMLKYYATSEGNECFLSSMRSYGLDTWK